jgi:hypothetical protein
MEFLQERLRDLKRQRTEVETRLQDLNNQLGPAADWQTATTLSLDIRNIEKALQVDGELRSPVNGPSKPIRLPILADETNFEFRARAERELAAVREA